MRGQTVLSFALVALATTSYAVPLIERTNSLDVREAIVEVDKDFSTRNTIVDLDELEDLSKRQVQVETSSSTIAADPKDDPDDQVEESANPLAGLLGDAGDTELEERDLDDDAEFEPRNISESSLDLSKRDPKKQKKPKKKGGKKKKVGGKKPAAATGAGAAGAAATDPADAADAADA